MHRSVNNPLQISYSFDDFMESRLFSPEGLVLCPSSLHSLEGKGGEIKLTELNSGFPKNCLGGRGETTLNKARIMTTQPHH